MIGGCSKVVQDVPPFMIVDGNPGETRTVNKVGMDRNGIPEPAQAALRLAYKKVVLVDNDKALPTLGFLI